MIGCFIIWRLKMKKIYKRILSLGLAVGVIFSLQESVHICAQENTQTTESIFADYGDENGGETDTAEQITGTGAEENTEQTTEETETGKNTEQTAVIERIFRMKRAISRISVDAVGEKC